MLFSRSVVYIVSILTFILFTTKISRLYFDKQTTTSLTIEQNPSFESILFCYFLIETDNQVVDRSSSNKLETMNKLWLNSSSLEYHFKLPFDFKLIQTYGYSGFRCNQLNNI